MQMPAPSFIFGRSWQIRTADQRIKRSSDSGNYVLKEEEA